MTSTTNQLADSVGAMTTGLSYVLEQLAAIEHRLTDTRADLLDPGSIEAAAVLSATDELAQLADYVTDLKTRTAPASPHPGPLSYGAATAAVRAALAQPTLSEPLAAARAALAALLVTDADDRRRHGPRSTQAGHEPPGGI
jgi:hypothetical protein